MTDREPGDREMIAWLASTGHSHNEYSSWELELMYAAWRAGRGEQSIPPGRPVPVSSPPPEVQQELMRLIGGERNRGRGA